MNVTPVMFLPGRNRLRAKPAVTGSPLEAKTTGRERSSLLSTETAAPGKAQSGLIVTSSPSALIHRDLIIKVAAQHRLPAIYPFRPFATGGGLASYGPDLVDPHRRAAGYVDRILKGEKPADLPVQAPTKFELVINLKTAKALGLTVSPTLLARADEVIE